MKKGFFDTSAILPLVLPEEHSQTMREEWPKFSERLAWSWILIEGEAALTRQKANVAAWQEWNRIARSLTLVELDPKDHPALRAFNRSLGLRTADAAHLFLCDRLQRLLDGLQLVSFDREMNQAAEKCSMAVFLLS